ncbi:MAG TPA: hypothetical protein PKE35_10000 [Anaerolineales bacterium]|nr:hypothetical protein [Anaerolineales bacterium]HMX18588.1 hypothetical protein [Anaerolineales bacterium]HMX74578.1 hypothetical protein [Anaerolineales bacterium]HMZ41492.1 hypothetical protein [Anaerolineales bacterium]HNB85322.1 hypothetical protein [Anaerolineales bacterium]
MKTPAGRECPHFYGNYFRGRNDEECRLLKLHGQAWTRDLCKTCPVPEIARANSCQHMQLKVTVERPILAMFQRRVQVSAFCEKSNQNVSEPQIGCGKCHDLPFKFEIKE